MQQRQPRTSQTLHFPYQAEYKTPKEGSHIQPSKSTPIAEH